MAQDIGFSAVLLDDFAPILHELSNLVYQLPDGALIDHRDIYAFSRGHFWVELNDRFDRVEDVNKIAALFSGTMNFGRLTIYNAADCGRDDGGKRPLIVLPGAVIIE